MSSAVAIREQLDQMAKGTKTEPLFLRVPAEDLERLDALAARIPVASRSAIARHALMLGLEMLEKDPGKLFAEPPAPAPAAKPARRKA